MTKFALGIGLTHCEERESKKTTPARMPLHQIYLLDLAYAVLPVPNEICGIGMKGARGGCAVPDLPNPINRSVNT